ncbi:MAG TPA: hypothetical protein VJU18_20600 [Vicinamibacteria bacterium]|nr:hypothetical protein [Vicinamibacteria bacterium]
MMKRRLVALAFLTLLPALASAQAVQNIVLRNSFNPIGAGARGLGMGGAFIGVADDGTASSFNPAGLAQLRRTEIALVGFSDRLRSTRNDLDSGRRVTESADHQKPDFFGLAVPFDLTGRNLTVQLSYQRSVDLFGKGTASTRDTVSLRDLGIPSPGTAELRGEIVPAQEGAFHTVSLATGYQATSRLHLGLAVNYWLADWTSSGQANFSVFTLAGGRTTLLRSDVRQFEQDQSLRGFNLTTGFLLKYSRVSIGGVVRLPFAGDYELAETGKTTTVEFGKPPVTTPTDISASSRLHWPQTAGLGIALRPFRGLTLAADYSESHWSRTTLDDIPDGALLTQRPATENGVEAEAGYSDRNFFDLLPASQTATSNTSQWRVGAEYLVSLSKLVIPLRGGTFRDQSPVLDFGRGEGRRIEGFTAGTGLNFKRLVLDLAFERRQSEGVVGVRVKRGQEAPTAASLETVREERWVASLIYRFGGGDDPLKRALRYLFVGGHQSE